MKIPKEKTKIRIKTDSAVIVGYVHTMKDARLSDYFSSQVDKFIPVTEAVIFPINYKIEDDNVPEKREVVFVNIAKIEIIEYF
ncbi:MAG: DUF6812 domain-containing protein [Candidatus Humimicrobiaceae bacterium]